MRLLSCLFAAVCICFLNSTWGFAQGVDERRSEERFEPYHKHHDSHHGHDHIYPDRGAIFREVPRGALVVNYAGVSYRFSDGVWFEPRGPAFIVVAPAVGLVVPTLPAYATSVEGGGETYLYANDVYYRVRPDLGGYEVVNDPDESTVPAATSTAATAPPSNSPAPATLAAAALSTAPAAQTAPAVTTAPTAPSAVSSPLLSSGASRGTKVFAYPKSGQTPEVQARDHYECYRFAVAQSGFDPMHSNGAAQIAEQQSDYERAQAACFEGRGYTIR